MRGASGNTNEGKKSDTCYKYSERAQSRGRGGRVKKRQLTKPNDDKKKISRLFTICIALEPRLSVSFLLLFLLCVTSEEASSDTLYGQPSRDEGGTNNNNELDWIKERKSKKRCEGREKQEENESSKWSERQRDTALRKSNHNPRMPMKRI